MTPLSHAAPLALFVGITAALVVATPAGAAPTCRPIDQEHTRWHALLQRHVQGGLVDYVGLKARSAELDAYLSELEGVCADAYKGFSTSQQLAYWINAYNAYTVKLILTHHPLKSIRDIGFLPGAAFRETFIPLQGLRGRSLSLNDIEHEILRKEFKEPRIHFAINCASASCPALLPEAFRARTLDAQLTRAARGFVNDRQKNRFVAATAGSPARARLSSIFKWFRDDFGGSDARTLAFIRPFLDAAAAAAVAGDAVDVEFLPYDWSLNERK